MPEQIGGKSPRPGEVVDWQKRYERLEENIPGMVFSLLLHADGR